MTGDLGALHCTWWDFLEHNFYYLRGQGCTQQVCIFIIPSSKCVKVLLGWMDKIKSEQSHRLTHISRCCAADKALVTACFVFKINMWENRLDMFQFGDSQKSWSHGLNSPDIWALQDFPFAQSLDALQRGHPDGDRVNRESQGGLLQSPQ